MMDDAHFYRSFNAMYANDKTLYGDPAKSEQKISDATTLENWQVTVNSHASQVRALGGMKRKQREE